MPTLTIKAVPEELLDRLRESAQTHRRSISSEAIACLERALTTRRLAPEDLLQQIDAVRTRVKLPLLTDEELRKAKEA